ncbi:MAG TPA: hypothetical protein ENF78_04225 [Candidatus Bathyarchaeota archaeon]|nr:hypothetical protein [Candidatus Bathyarchaeota archaeon]
MKLYLRWPFIGLLAILSVALVAISMITEVKFAGEEVREYTVPAYKLDFIVEEPFSGIVRVSGHIPEGVKVYVLTYRQYWTYERTGELPSDYLASEEDEIIVRDPSYVLIQNPKSEEAHVQLCFEVYEEHKPYALLAIPSFFLTIIVSALVLMRLFWMGEARGP